jgi:FkbM family methyltransferase
MNILKRIYAKLPYKIQYLWKYPKHLIKNYVMLNFLLKKINSGFYAIPLKNLNTKIIFPNKLELELECPEATFGYFLNYIPKKGDVIIDVGSYPGDFTIVANYFLNNSGKIICFEPDINNYKILCNNIKKYKIKNVKIIKKGLWNKKDVLHFDTNKGESSITKNGKYIIKVNTLDNELKSLKIKKVDFIKMDVEGAELEALKGMKKTLKNNNCKLAIASYHYIKGKQTYRRCEKFLKKLNYKVKTENKEHLTTYAFKK